MISQFLNPPRARGSGIFRQAVEEESGRINEYPLGRKWTGMSLCRFDNSNGCQEATAENYCCGRWILEEPVAMDALDWLWPYFTFSVSVVEWLRVPDVPVTVSP